VFTVSVNAVEVEPAELAFPEYTAVISSAPEGKLLAEKVANPDELSVTVLRRVEPL
jgi:hypothetical protein